MIEFVEAKVIMESVKSTLGYVTLIPSLGMVMFSTALIHASGPCMDRLI